MNAVLTAQHADESIVMEGMNRTSSNGRAVDAYFSADVATDGPIPGPYSILSFGLVYAGVFDGSLFTQPENYAQTFYRELRPISEEFQSDALRVNGLDRNRLLKEGASPDSAMAEARRWIEGIAGEAQPVLVAYPLSFDWSWLYWYFVRFTGASPFNHSLCFDIKTAFAVKAGIPIAEAGKSKLLPSLRPRGKHTHHALEDAIEQAEIFANVFQWEGTRGGTP
jgi:3' exoribonuclease, RNase T-like